MATLTRWEVNQLESINLLLIKAERAKQDLEQKDQDLKSGKVKETSEDWLTFRAMMIDLYSVLDYTYFLLYCHFSNKGELDLGPDGRYFSFPYTPKGVKTRVEGQTYAHDERKTFVKKKMQSLMGKKLHLSEEAHFWQVIGRIILGVQPKLEVNSSGDMVNSRGTVVYEAKPKISCGEEESFALLHFYRNCTAHRDLIRFVPEKSWVEINQSTRQTKLVKKHQGQKGYHYCELDEGYWVTLPETIVRQEHRDEESRLLLDVLSQLMAFVTNISHRLLHASLLLPPPSVLLQKHIAECKSMKTKFSTTATGQYEARVTLKLNHGEMEFKSFTAVQKEDAEEEACCLIIQELAKTAVYPKHPYALFTPQYVKAHPPVLIVNMEPDKTPLMVVHQCNQKLKCMGLKI